jgi:hypothetical protein
MRTLSSPRDSGTFPTLPSTPLRYVLGYHDSAPAALRISGSLLHRWTRELVLTHTFSSGVLIQRESARS